jgi:hypothetical protein
MSDSRSHGLPSPGVCAGIVVAMLAMIAIPATITLHAVHEPLPLVPVNQHSTPHGYTVNISHQGFAAASQEGRLRDERQALAETIRRNEEMLARARSQIN